MSGNRIKDLQEDERPRERMQRTGAGALRTAELIAILLRSGMRGKSAVQVGDELLQTFGSLESLARADIRQLCSIKGISLAKACQLKAAFEIGVRLARSSLREIPLDTPQRVMELLGDEMRMLSHESLRVITVNGKLKVKHVKEISRGTHNETVAHPRDILQEAIQQTAHGFILVHNHPSGDPAPSRADLEFTQRLRDAARIMQVEFIDHIILGSPAPGRDAYYSFKEAGYL